MTQYFTTHKISVRNGIGKDEALDLVLDRIATYISADNWGEHSDATLGAWTLKWTHATKEERSGSIWVYTIDDEDGNVVEAFFATGETIYKLPESVIE